MGRSSSHLRLFTLPGMMVWSDKIAGARMQVPVK